ncbi:thiamine pyrophosphate-binding protein [Indiicoccus explosivorum]|uniref:thiamine pyrophosphate-binding protein n=1 Tax=Indiicoccus explosivorum TaxID=1917864 RepID=UPI000B43CE80|nr:thiamine pyrophosphate-binding protein [Indiicoccus explosivorum]
MRAVNDVVAYLKQTGVEVIFGIPAGSVNAFFDELYGVPEITPVIAKHEGAAAYMAASYAKYAGKMGVCIGSSGPGGTNLVSGAANAMREQLPVLFLTGAVPVSTMGLNASQELDAAPVFAPVTKYSVTVTDSGELLHEVAKAVEIAHSGVPGPVHVAMPIDVQMGDAGRTEMPELKKRAGLVPDSQAVSAVADRLAAGKPGILFAGQGVRGSVSKVMELAGLLGWPVVATPVAKGLFRNDHPLFAGIFGFAGDESASELISGGTAETIFVLGSNLGETATNNYNPGLTDGRFFIQADHDPTVFGRKYNPDIELLGDMDLILSELIRELEWRGLEKPGNPLDYRRPAEESGEDYNTKNVLLKLQQFLPPSTRYTIDIGEFMSYVIHHLPVLEEDTYDINVHFGAMGSGLSAAIGSKFAEPDRPTVAITGDGCFFMHGMELLTAKEYNLPILFVVMNNARLGMVYHGHTLQYKRSHPTFEQQPADIAAMAAALGITSVRVESMEDLERGAVENLMASSGPAILEIALTDNNIPPMGDRVKFLSSFGK